MFEPKATASHLDSTPLRHAETVWRYPLFGVDRKWLATAKTARLIHRGHPEKSSEMSEALRYFGECTIAEVLFSELLLVDPQWLSPSKRFGRVGPILAR
jgi:hypothetical protein